MHDDRERIHRIASDKNVELDHGRLPVAGEVVVERGVSAGDRLQAVVKVEHDFVQRQLVLQHDAVGSHVFEALLFAAFFFDQRQNAADIFFVGEDGRENHRLFNFRDFAGVGPTKRIVHLNVLAVGFGDLVAHAGSGGDQLKIELALQALLNNLHVQQAEKATAEAESERYRAFRLKEKRRIVEAKFVQRLAQLRVLVRVHGVEAGEDHRFDVFKAGQRLDGGVRVVGNGVADFGVGNVLDVSDQESDFARAELTNFDGLGREHAKRVHIEHTAIRPQADLLPFVH